MTSAPLTLSFSWVAWKLWVGYRKLRGSFISKLCSILLMLPQRATTGSESPMVPCNRNSQAPPHRMHSCISLELTCDGVQPSQTFPNALTCSTGAASFEEEEFLADVFEWPASRWSSGSLCNHHSHSIHLTATELLQIVQRAVLTRSHAKQYQCP